MRHTYSYIDEAPRPTGCLGAGTVDAPLTYPNPTSTLCSTPYIIKSSFSILPHIFSVVWEILIELIQQKTGKVIVDSLNTIRQSKSISTFARREYL